MYDFEEVQFDEHVKTYQRYWLIELLESGKNEKIRELKGYRKNNTKKVAVPLLPDDMVVLTDTDEKTKKNIREKFDGIYYTVVDVPEAIVIEKLFKEDNKSIQEKFAGIKATVDVPEAVVIEDRSAEDRKSMQEKFAGIITKIEVPEAEAFSGISTNQDKSKIDEIERYAASIRVPDKAVVDSSIIAMCVPTINLGDIKMVNCSDIMEMLNNQKTE